MFKVLASGGQKDIYVWWLIKTDSSQALHFFRTLKSYKGNYVRARKRNNGHWILRQTLKGA